MRFTFEKGGATMFTVRLGDKDFPAQDLATLSAMLKAGQVQPNSPVYDHAAGSWRTVDAVLAPPAAAPSQAAPPQFSPSQTGHPGQSAPVSPGVQKTTPALAIWSFVLSLIGMVSCLFLGVVGIFLGFKARRLIDDNPEQYQGRGLATAGIILGGIQVVLLPVAVLALIAIPNFINLRVNAYNASAQSYSYNAKIAEELYYNLSNAENGSYTDNLRDLLAFDKNLTDDSDVTFIFGNCTSIGYTFTTTHANGDAEYPVTD
jgi:Tfp pilus assembly protein PilE